VIAADPMVLVGGLQMNARLMAQRESGRHLLAWLSKAVTVTLLSFAALTETKGDAAVVCDANSPPTWMTTSLGKPWEATLDSQDRGEREG